MVISQKGDRVRCIYGPNVIIGEVDSVWEEGMYVHLTPPPDAVYDVVGRNVWITNAWDVEIIPPPAPQLPEVEGTVVLGNLNVPSLEECDDRADFGQSVGAIGGLRVQTCRYCHALVMYHSWRAHKHWHRMAVTS